MAPRCRQAHRGPARPYRFNPAALATADQPSAGARELRRSKGRAPASSRALIAIPAACAEVPEQANRSLEATLEDYLREREALMVLDNCEHVVEGAAQLVQTLL